MNRLIHSRNKNTKLVFKAVKSKILPKDLKAQYLREKITIYLIRKLAPVPVV